MVWGRATPGLTSEVGLFADSRRRADARRIVSLLGLRARARQWRPIDRVVRETDLLALWFRRFAQKVPFISLDSFFTHRPLLSSLLDPRWMVYSA